MKLLSSTKISTLSQYDIETDNSNFLIFDSSNSNSESIIAHNSMIFPLYTREGTFLGTRAGVTDVSKLAFDYVLRFGLDYDKFIFSMMQANMCPIFEFCSRSNRVVIDYPEDMLVLTGIRSLETGRYCSYDFMKELGLLYGLPVVKKIKSISHSGFESFKNSVSELQNDEGVVMRFVNSGFMIKMKSTDYCIAHRALDSLSFDKDILKLFLTGQLDDIVPLISVDRKDRVMNFVNNFNHCLTLTNAAIMKAFNEVNSVATDQKDFALRVMNSKYKHFLFKLRNGKNLESELVDYAMKACSTQANCAMLQQFLNMTVKY